MNNLNQDMPVIDCKRYVEGYVVKHLLDNKKIISLVCKTAIVLKK